MAGRPLGNQTIIRLRTALPDVADEGGNLRRDWTAPAAANIPGCQVDPGPTVEAQDNRSTLLTTWFVYAPSGTDMTEDDRAVFRGDVYLVDGKPVDWPDGGSLDYVKITLKEWKG